jgi:hypothetical protein
MKGGCWQGRLVGTSVVGAGVNAVMALWLDSLQRVVSAFRSVAGLRKLLGGRRDQHGAELHRTPVGSGT